MRWPALPLLCMAAALAAVAMPASAVGPAAVAKADRRLWTETLNSRNGFDKASRASILTYASALQEMHKMADADMMASFKLGGSVVTQVAINAHVELKVVKGDDGKLRFDIGTPTTYVDIIDEAIEGSNQLSNAEFEAIVSFALSRIVAVGSGSVGAIPLPAVGGVAVTTLDISQQHGYLIVDGEVQ